MKTVAFTIRIPEELVEQIDLRRQFSRRSRNAEITYMLENAIDESVRRDLSLRERDPISD